MKREISWIARVMVVVLVAMSGMVVMTALSAPERPVAVARPGGAEAGVEFAVQRDCRSDIIEPAAICRLIPECSSNAECDEKCGVGQGKCVHSNCPVRICRCR